VTITAYAVQVTADETDRLDLQARCDQADYRNHPTSQD
jgi:hypothetical protein